LKILVVGGAGYVGGSLVDELTRQGFGVAVYDKLLYENKYLKRVEFFKGDIRDVDRITNVAKYFDIVIWLAALVGDPLCALSPELTKKINEDVPIEFAKRFNGKMVFMSTCSIYGAQEGILNESSPTAPLSLYAQTKFNAETAILAIKPDALVFRLGTLFGLSDEHARLRADLVLNLLVMRAVFAREITVFGGQQYRPLLHVRDVGIAIIDALHVGASGAFNLHCENITIVELGKRISVKVPNVVLTITEQSFQDSRNYAVTSELACHTFGFKPKFDVNFGIEEVKLALEEGRFPRILDPNFSNADMMRDFLSLTKNSLMREVFKS